MKKLSVITICYNEPGLEETCQSIVNQTWQDFEWIVIDGGSNIETQKIWDKYKYRIDKFISEPDNGIYNAYNKGIRLATSEYINLMNAGDRYYTNDTLKLFTYFSQFNKGDIYYGETEFDLKQEERNFISRYPQNLTKKWLLEKNINTQSNFVKKSLFDKYGMFNEEYRIISDYEKWLQFIIGKESFCYLPIIVASYNAYGISSVESTKQIYYTEKTSVIKKYYTENQLKEWTNVNTGTSENTIDITTYSVLEQIFSIKNSTDKKHRIITILGLHVKIKRK